ncbi:MAG TPA: VOC family protein [Pirellulales bacterium]|jgi:catechol 2,3-dioxygenase-like lactoylglutathione lyase family enzyme|nr:VOC family protein [Pirellulales bacterium]HEX4146450.1 VOC family protein [Pirellulales bacterium]
MSHGFAHLGLATHDMPATIAFYEGMLGFPRVADIQNHVTGGGVVRMVYFECGDEQFLVFMEIKGVQGIPVDFDTGINGALGVPSGLYHFAFKAKSVDALEKKKRDLEQRGVAVSEFVDHGYAQSIFVRDPNGLQVEFCCMTRPFEAADLHQEQQVKVATSSSKTGASDS